MSAKTPTTKTPSRQSSKQGAEKASLKAPKGESRAPSSQTSERKKVFTEQASDVAPGPHKLEDTQKPKKVETVVLVDFETDTPIKPVPTKKPKASLKGLAPIAPTAKRPLLPAAPPAEPLEADPSPPPVQKKEVLDLIGAGEAKKRPAAEQPDKPVQLKENPVTEAKRSVSEDGLGEKQAEGPRVIHLKPPISVTTLTQELGLKPYQVISDLMAMNIFANRDETIDVELAQKVCQIHGAVLEIERREKGGGVHKPEQVVVEPAPPPEPAKEELQQRAPIITFMGHVDHGKTSLMDAIRATRVAAGEVGGITQHIGAYSVTRGKQRFTFIDTPGHRAFTEMRARGAKVTDIVVLVVAADDGIMPQTIEAISHAKAAGVPIIVAINKIDLPGANIDRVKTGLQQHDLTPEDWGGETICVPVSATKGMGIDELLEMIALQAEILELKASATETARGTVIEAQMESGRGPTATVIVSRGTLKPGAPFICGDHWGKIKAMLDDRGQQIKEAPPSTPVKILGFSGLPQAGDELVVMESERDARALSEERLFNKRQEKLAAPQRPTLENLYAELAGESKKVLRLILKSDVQGSLEAIVQSLKEIQSEKIDLEIIHNAVGPISESDALLAAASNAVIVGFNVKVENAATNTAKREGVQIKLYSIIYELIDQVKEAMAGLLDPELRESVVGHAQVRKVFELSRGVVAGCMVTDGRILRNGRARVLRGRQPIYDGGVATLRRFQDDVKEVRPGLECGIRLGDFNEYEEGDIIECYLLEKVPQQL